MRIYDVKVLGVRAAVLLGVVLGAPSFMFACSSDDDNEGTAGNSGSSGSSGSSGTSGSSGNSGGTAGTGAGTASGGQGGIADICGGSCVCANGNDDDGDGLIDGLDPECTGPYDNDEGSFATGIPGDNRDPKWQDCFFDGNSGAGDDQCRYHTDCLYGVLDASDPDCQSSAACVSFCASRTPNGCDCFGCCTIQLDDGTSEDIIIGGSCSIENIADESACPRCTKTTQCDNGCGECELCLGKTVEDLPESCTPPETDAGTPPGYTCDNGETVCSADLPCPGSYYCSLGCCLPQIE